MAEQQKHIDTRRPISARDLHITLRSLAQCCRFTAQTFHAIHVATAADPTSASEDVARWANFADSLSQLADQARHLGD